MKKIYHIRHFENMVLLMKKMIRKKQHPDTERLERMLKQYEDLLDYARNM